MKTLIYLLISLGAILNNLSFAQVSCIKGGQNILNVYYGTDFTKRSMEIYYEGYEDLKVTGTGNLGAIFEHVITKRFGFGGEFGYSNAKATFKVTPYIPVSKMESYTYTYNYTHIRAQLRLNFYFLSTKNYNAYGFVNGGYSNYIYSSESNFPGAVNSSQSSKIPFGIKTGLGIRYISDQLGLFVEMALGTPLMSIGLCAKF